MQPVMKISSKWRHFCFSVCITNGKRAALWSYMRSENIYLYVENRVNSIAIISDDCRENLSYVAFVFGDAPRVIRAWIMIR